MDDTFCFFFDEWVYYFEAPSKTPSKTPSVSPVSICEPKHYLSALNVTQFNLQNDVCTSLWPRWEQEIAADYEKCCCLHPMSFTLTEQVKTSLLHKFILFFFLTALKKLYFLK